MIINDQYKFCFFAIPRTASKAVSKALIDSFNSRVHLRMHATYAEFEAQASREEKNYFRFTTVRNPIDSIVSSYFKKKNDHNGRFSRGTFRKGQPIAPKAMEQYRFIKDNDASFSEFFRVFHTEPYRRKQLEHTVDNCHFVMKFENLNNDFQQLLRKLNLPPIEIPVVNTTQGKSRDYLQYYTPDIIPQAKEVFKELMDKWGYDFPDEWSEY